MKCTEHNSQEAGQEHEPFTGSCKGRWSFRLFKACIDNNVEQHYHIWVNVSFEIIKTVCGQQNRIQKLWQHNVQSEQNTSNISFLNSQVLILRLYWSVVKYDKHNNSHNDI